MNINKAIQSALENQRKGNLKEAEFLYKKILKKQPDNPDVLHMLGVLFSELANYDLAIKYIKRALQFGPSNIASAYHDLGSPVIKRQLKSIPTLPSHSIILESQNGINMTLMKLYLVFRKLSKNHD